VLLTDTAKEFTSTVYSVRKVTDPGRCRLWERLKDWTTCQLLRLDLRY
jgi:hypothetical protein